MISVLALVIQKNQKLIYDFEKEMNFKIKQQGRKSNRDKSMIKLLKSPAGMASRISTIISSENSDGLCDKWKLLLQEKQAGITSNIVGEEIVNIVDNLVEYNCISTKQYKFLLCKWLH